MSTLRKKVFSDTTVKCFFFFMTQINQILLSSGMLIWERSKCYIINLIVHVSSHFFQSALHCPCLISFPSLHISFFMFHLFTFISFIPQSISFVSFAIVHLIHIQLIWLHSYYSVIQPYCQFHFSVNPVSRNYLYQVPLDKVLILDIHYLKLNSGGFTTPCLFIKYRMVSEKTFQFVQQPTLSFNLFDSSICWQTVKIFIFQLIMDLEARTSSSLLI